MLCFEIFVKAMPPSLSELKVLLSFCFAFKIPDNVAASITYVVHTLFKKWDKYADKVYFSRYIIDQEKNKKLLSNGHPQSTL